MYPLLLSSVLIYCLLLYNVGVGSLALVLLLLLRFFDSCHHPTPTTCNSHCWRHYDDLRLASVKYGMESFWRHVYLGLPATKLV